MNICIKGQLKHRHKKKWKTRWAVVKRTSPVTEVVTLCLYKCETDSCKRGREKETVSLQHFSGLETGFQVERERHVLAVVTVHQVALLAFPSRDQLLDWQAQLRTTLGQEHSFVVTLLCAPAPSRLHQTPARLLLQRTCLALVAHAPPRLLVAWQLTHLRAFGPVGGDKFVLDGGESAGHGCGQFVLLTDFAAEIHFRLTRQAAVLCGLPPVTSPPPTGTTTVQSKPHTAAEAPRRPSLALAPVASPIPVTSPVTNRHLAQIPTTAPREANIAQAHTAAPSSADTPSVVPHSHHHTSQCSREGRGGAFSPIGRPTATLEKGSRDGPGLTAHVPVPRSYTSQPSKEGLSGLLSGASSSKEGLSGSLSGASSLRGNSHQGKPPSCDNTEDATLIAVTLVKHGGRQEELEEISSNSGSHQTELYTKAALGSAKESPPLLNQGSLYDQGSLLAAAVHSECPPRSVDPVHQQQQQSQLDNSSQSGRVNGECVSQNSASSASSALDPQTYRSTHHHSPYTGSNRSAVCSDASFSPAVTTPLSSTLHHKDLLKQSSESSAICCDDAWLQRRQNPQADEKYLDNKYTANASLDKSAQKQDTNLVCDFSDRQNYATPNALQDKNDFASFTTLENQAIYNYSADIESQLTSDHKDYSSCWPQEADINNSSHRNRKDTSSPKHSSSFRLSSNNFLARQIRKAVGPIFHRHSKSSDSTLEDSQRHRQSPDRTSPFPVSKTSHPVPGKSPPVTHAHFESAYQLDFAAGEGDYMDLSEHLKHTRKENSLSAQYLAWEQSILRKLHPKLLGSPSNSCSQETGGISPVAALHPYENSSVIERHRNKLLENPLSLNIGDSRTKEALLRASVEGGCTTVSPTLLSPGGLSNGSLSPYDFHCSMNLLDEVLKVVDQQNVPKPCQNTSESKPVFCDNSEDLNNPSSKCCQNVAVILSSDFSNESVNSITNLSPCKDNFFNSSCTVSHHSVSSVTCSGVFAQTDTSREGQYPVGGAPSECLLSYSSQSGNHCRAHHLSPASCRHSGASLIGHQSLLQSGFQIRDQSRHPPLTVPQIRNTTRVYSSGPTSEEASSGDTNHLAREEGALYSSHNFYKSSHLASHSTETLGECDNCAKFDTQPPHPSLHNGVSSFEDDQQPQNCVAPGEQTHHNSVSHLQASSINFDVACVSINKPIHNNHIDPTSHTERVLLRPGGVDMSCPGATTTGVGADAPSHAPSHAPSQDSKRPLQFVDLSQFDGADEGYLYWVKGDETDSQSKGTPAQQHEYNNIRVPTESTLEYINLHASDVSTDLSAQDKTSKTSKAVSRNIYRNMGTELSKQCGGGGGGNMCLGNGHATQTVLTSKRSGVTSCGEQEVPPVSLLASHTSQSATGIHSTASSSKGSTATDANYCNTLSFESGLSLQDKSHSIGTRSADGQPNSSYAISANSADISPGLRKATDKPPTESSTIPKSHRAASKSGWTGLAFHASLRRSKRKAPTHTTETGPQTGSGSDSSQSASSSQAPSTVAGSYVTLRADAHVQRDAQSSLCAIPNNTSVSGGGLSAHAHNSALLFVDYSDPQKDNLMNIITEQQRRKLCSAVVSKLQHLATGGGSKPAQTAQLQNLMPLSQRSQAEVANLMIPKPLSQTASRSSNQASPHRIAQALPQHGVNNPTARLPQRTQSLHNTNSYQEPTSDFLLVKASSYNKKRGDSSKPTPHNTQHASALSSKAVERRTSEPELGVRVPLVRQRSDGSLSGHVTLSSVPPSPSQLYQHPSAQHPHSSVTPAHSQLPRQNTTRSECEYIDMSAPKTHVVRNATGLNRPQHSDPGDAYTCTPQPPERPPKLPPKLHSSHSLSSRSSSSSSVSSSATGQQGRSSQQSLVGVGAGCSTHDDNSGINQSISRLARDACMAKVFASSAGCVADVSAAATTHRDQGAAPRYVKTHSHTAGLHTRVNPALHRLNSAPCGLCSSSKGKGEEDNASQYIDMRAGCAPLGKAGGKTLPLDRSTRAASGKPVTASVEVNTCVPQHVGGVREGGVPRLPGAVPGCSMASLDEADDLEESYFFMPAVASDVTPATAPDSAAASERFLLEAAVPPLSSSASTGCVSSDAYMPMKAICRPNSTTSIKTIRTSHTDCILNAPTFQVEETCHTRISCETSKDIQESVVLPPELMCVLNECIDRPLRPFDVFEDTGYDETDSHKSQLKGAAKPSDKSDILKPFNLLDIDQDVTSWQGRSAASTPERASPSKQDKMAVDSNQQTPPTSRRNSKSHGLFARLMRRNSSAKELPKISRSQEDILETPGEALDLNAAIPPAMSPTKSKKEPIYAQIEDLLGPASPRATLACPTTQPLTMPLKRKDLLRLGSAESLHGDSDGRFSGEGGGRLLSVSSVCSQRPWLEAGNLTDEQKQSCSSLLSAVGSIARSMTPPTPPPTLPLPPPPLPPRPGRNSLNAAPPIPPKTYLRSRSHPGHPGGHSADTKPEHEYMDIDEHGVYQIPGGQSFSPHPAAPHPAAARFSIGETCLVRTAYQGVVGGDSNLALDYAANSHETATASFYPLTNQTTDTEEGCHGAPCPRPPARPPRGLSAPVPGARPPLHSVDSADQLEASLLVSCDRKEDEEAEGDIWVERYFPSVKSRAGSRLRSLSLRSVRSSVSSDTSSPQPVSSSVRASVCSDTSEAGTSSVSQSSLGSQPSYSETQPSPAANRNIPSTQPKSSTPPSPAQSAHSNLPAPLISEFGSLACTTSTASGQQSSAVVPASLRAAQHSSQAPPRYRKAPPPSPLTVPPTSAHSLHNSHTAPQPPSPLIGPLTAPLAAPASPFRAIHTLVQSGDSRSSSGGPASSVLRPRAGREYQVIDRRRLLPHPTSPNSESHPSEPSSAAHTPSPASTAPFCVFDFDPVVVEHHRRSIAHTDSCSREVASVAGTALKVQEATKSELAECTAKSVTEDSAANSVSERSASPRRLLISVTESAGAAVQSGASLTPLQQADGSKMGPPNNNNVPCARTEFRGGDPDPIYMNLTFPASSRLGGSPLIIDALHSRRGEGRTAGGPHSPEYANVVLNYAEIDLSGSSGGNGSSVAGSNSLTNSHHHRRSGGASSRNKNQRPSSTQPLRNGALPTSDANSNGGTESAGGSPAAVIVSGGGSVTEYSVIDMVATMAVSEAAKKHVISRDEDAAHARNRLSSAEQTGNGNSGGKPARKERKFMSGNARSFLSRSHSTASRNSSS